MMSLPAPRPPLLKTKLHIPCQPDHMVRRPALIEQLSQGLQRKLTVLTTPAGYGKTTLLSQWAAQASVPVVWLTLDQRDNEPKRFFSYLIAAIQQQYPEYGHELQALLDVTETPEPDFILPLLIADWAAISAEFALVLDDYQAIEAPPIHQALAFLLEHLPEHIHLFMGSRFVPEHLPLAKLRIRRQLGEMALSQLRFAPADIESFFQQQGVTLSAPQAALLAEKTEGWGLSLQLALLSMQESANPASALNSFSGRHRYVVDYLLEDIFPILPVDLQQFMLMTAIVPEFTASLCQMITGRPDCSLVLDELERKNTFLIPLDQQREWYRYHHLIREWLVHRLTQEQPALALDSHRQAARWYAQQGMFAQAITQAAQAADADFIAAVIVQQAFFMVACGEIKQLSEWFTHLSEPVILSNTTLATFYGWVRVLSQQLPLAAAWLDTMATTIVPEKADAHSWAAHLANMRATLARRRSDADAVIGYTREALSYPHSQEPFIAAVAYFNLGIGYLLSHRYPDARQAFEEAIAYNRQAGNTLTALAAQTCRARIYMLQGELYEAERQYQQLLKDADHKHLSKHSLVGTIWIDLACIYAYRHQPVEMKQALKTGLSLTRQSYNTDSTYGYSNALQVLLTLQEMRTATDLFAEAEDFARRKELAGLQPVLNYQQLRLWHLSGKVEAFQDQLPLLIQRVQADTQFRYPFDHVTLIQWYLQKNQPFEALAYIEPLLHTLEQRGQWLHLPQLLGLKSRALYQQNQPQMVIAVLQQALKIAEPRGLIRGFSDVIQPLVTLLAEAISTVQSSKTPLDSQYLALLAEALGVPAFQSGDSFLSEREQEFLRLLEAGLSNQAISEQLFVSLNTTKTHLKNIFRKLDVQNRTQAIAKFREWYPGNT